MVKTEACTPALSPLEGPSGNGSSWARISASWRCTITSAYLYRHRKGQETPNIQHRDEGQTLTHITSSFKFCNKGRGPTPLPALVTFPMPLPLLHIYIYYSSLLPSPYLRIGEVKWV